MCFVFSLSDIDDCQGSPCHTDATCLDHVNNFTCVCQPGFTGQLCDQGKSEVRMANHVLVVVTITL